MSLDIDVSQAATTLNIPFDVNGTETNSNLVKNQPVTIAMFVKAMPQQAATLQASTLKLSFNISTWYNFGLDLSVPSGTSSAINQAYSNSAGLGNITAFSKSDVTAGDVQDKWVLAYWTYSAIGICNIISCDTLQPIGASGSEANPFAMSNSAPTSMQLRFSSGRFRIGEIAVWDRDVLQSELIQYAETGFASENHPTDLRLNYNFLTDFTLDGSPNTWENLGRLGRGSILYTPATGVVTSYNLDNPVEVYQATVSVKNPHDLTLNISSATLGDVRVGVYAVGSPVPTDAEVFAGTGTGVINSATGTIVDANPVSVTVNGLTSGTQYDVYSVQEVSSGVYGSVTNEAVYTALKYSEIITDITGTPVGVQTGIDWAWFDSTQPDAMSTPSVTGSGASTDANGLAELTLPYEDITTAKGSKGTMVLRSDWNSEVQSASHIVAVK